MDDKASVGKSFVDKPNAKRLQGIQNHFPEVDPIDFHNQVELFIEDFVGCKMPPEVKEFFIDMECETPDMTFWSEKAEESVRRELCAINGNAIQNIIPILPRNLTGNPSNDVVAAGGLTQIHILCLNKDNSLSEEEILALVKDLRENKKADINIKDNSGLRAIDRAKLRGYTTVVSYLASSISE